MKNRDIQVSYTVCSTLLWHADKEGDPLDWSWGFWRGPGTMRTSHLDRIVDVCGGVGLGEDGKDQAKWKLRRQLRSLGIILFLHQFVTYSMAECTGWSKLASGVAAGWTIVDEEHQLDEPQMNRLGKKGV